MRALSMAAADPATPEPDVRDPSELEQTLYGAVLAVGPVEHGEEEVRRRDHRSRPTRRRRRPPSDGLGTRKTATPPSPGTLVPQVPAPRLVDEDGHDLVPVAEARRHRRRRTQADLVLPRAAAEEDCYPEPRLP